MNLLEGRKGGEGRMGGRGWGGDGGRVGREGGEGTWGREGGWGERDGVLCYPYIFNVLLYTHVINMYVQNTLLY